MNSDTAKGVILAEGLRDLWAKHQLSVGGGAGLHQDTQCQHWSRRCREHEKQMGFLMLTATPTGYTSQCVPDKKAAWANLLDMSPL